LKKAAAVKRGINSEKEPLEQSVEKKLKFNAEEII